MISPLKFFLKKTIITWLRAYSTIQEKSLTPKIPTSLKREREVTFTNQRIKWRMTMKTLKMPKMMDSIFKFPNTIKISSRILKLALIISTIARFSNTSPKMIISKDLSQEIAIEQRR